MNIRIFGFTGTTVGCGPGKRFAVYTQGCSIRCPGCYAPHSHDPKGGFNKDIDELVEYIVTSDCDGISFLGGEPTEQAAACAEIAVKVLKQKEMDIMVSSGYTLDYLLKKAKRNQGLRSLLAVTNTLVDGGFDSTCQEKNLKYRGSLNQRIYDISEYPKTTDIYDITDSIE